MEIGEETMRFKPVHDFTIEHLKSIHHITQLTETRIFEQFTVEVYRCLNGTPCPGFTTSGFALIKTNKFI